MSTACKPSNPTFAHGLIDVIDEDDHTRVLGHTQYGYLKGSAALGVGGMTEQHPRDIVFELCANTSRDMVLHPGLTYSMTVRFLKRPKNNTFVAYYIPGKPCKLGPTDSINADNLNKVIMTGLGVVTAREEIPRSDTQEDTLRCTIRHTDWDSEAQAHVEFNVIYLVLKKGVLVNSFGLFQVGRELSVTGKIVDWDEGKGTWVVNTNTVAVTSGASHSVSVKSSHKGADGVTSPRKRALYKAQSNFSNNRISDVVNKNNMSHKGDGSQCNKQVANSPMECGSESIHMGDIIPRPEDGEVLEKGFVDTYPKKRSQGVILQDARRRMKGH